LLGIGLLETGKKVFIQRPVSLCFALKLAKRDAVFHFNAGPLFQILQFLLKLRLFGARYIDFVGQALHDLVDFFGNFILQVAVFRARFDHLGVQFAVARRHFRFAAPYFGLLLPQPLNQRRVQHVGGAVHAVFRLKKILDAAQPGFGLRRLSARGNQLGVDILHLPGRNRGALNFDQFRLLAEVLDGLFGNFDLLLQNAKMVVKPFVRPRGNFIFSFQLIHQIFVGDGVRDKRRFFGVTGIEHDMNAERAAVVCNHEPFADIPGDNAALPAFLFLGRRAPKPPEYIKSGKPVAGIHFRILG